MTQKLAAALVAAVLLCGASSLVAAQDNNTNAAPAANAGANPSDKGAASEKTGKKHEHGMDACKDDVAKLCADVKGHKKVHECLEKNEDQLSPACKKHHEAMEKKWKKKHGAKGEKAEKGGDMDKGAAPAPESTPNK